jgi:hypothetical protein
MLNDVWVPLIIAAFASAVAAFWPWLQAFQRGWRFRRLIRRELEEIGPHPPQPEPDKPWWEHATKRFIHEEIFQRANISQNRDFVLSLDPTVVYLVSQLWIALERRDGRQWEHFLKRIAENHKLRSEKLTLACDGWIAILKAQKPGFLETMGVPTAFRQDATLRRVSSLFERRFHAYGQLLPLTKYGTEQQAGDLDSKEREGIADSMTRWFYEAGAGLLLSGRAHEQFERAREILRSPSPSPSAVRHELSQLRTDLKIDLGVRQPQERGIAMAWPEEERW